MIEIVAIVIRALAVTGLVVVLDNHVHLELWEGGVLSFCGMMLLATLYDIKR